MSNLEKCSYTVCTGFRMLHFINFNSLRCHGFQSVGSSSHPTSQYGNAEREGNCVQQSHGRARHRSRLKAIRSRCIFLWTLARNQFSTEPAQLRQQQKTRAISLLHTCGRLTREGELLSLPARFPWVEFRFLPDKNYGFSYPDPQGVGDFVSRDDFFLLRVYAKTFFPVAVCESFFRVPLQVGGRKFSLYRNMVSGDLASLDVCSGT